MSEESDDLPRTLRPKPTNLDTMSIGELEEYIVELETEIARIRAEIDRKEAQKQAAESVFKR